MTLVFSLLGLIVLDYSRNMSVGLYQVALKRFLEVFDIRFINVVYYCCHHVSTFLALISTPLLSAVLAQRALVLLRRVSR